MRIELNKPNQRRDRKIIKELNYSMSKNRNAEVHLLHVHWEWHEPQEQCTDRGKYNKQYFASMEYLKEAANYYSKGKHANLTQSIRLPENLYANLIKVYSRPKTRSLVSPLTYRSIILNSRPSNRLITNQLIQTNLLTASYEGAHKTDHILWSSRIVVSNINLRHSTNIFKHYTNNKQSLWALKVVQEMTWK